VPNGAGVPRPGGRGTPARLLIFIAVVLATGCSSTRQDPAGNGPLVAWDGTEPPQLRPAPAAPAPPCQAGALKVDGAGFQFAPAISGGTGEVTLRNAGSAACRLTGRPDVRVIGAVPEPAQRQTPLPAESPAFPAVVPPDRALLSVPPGAAVTASVDWLNWCISPSATKPIAPKAIRLTLPSGTGSLDVDYNAVPACDSPEAPTTLGVRPFRPAPLPASTPWTTSVVQAAIQPLSGGRGQLTGRRGEEVRFAVELRNRSTAPIPFDRCPLVVEVLAPAGASEVHQLNCRAAGQLPATGSLRFEMRIRVPADAPPGSNGLFWELDPTGAGGPEAVSKIVVIAG